MEKYTIQFYYTKWLDLEINQYDFKKLEIFGLAPEKLAYTDLMEQLLLIFQNRKITFSPTNGLLKLIVNENSVLALFILLFNSFRIILLSFKINIFFIIFKDSCSESN
jgi:hypothetical protein